MNEWSRTLLVIHIPSVTKRDRATQENLKNWYLCTYFNTRDYNHIYAQEIKKQMKISLESLNIYSSIIKISLQHLLYLNTLPQTQDDLKEIRLSLAIKTWKYLGWWSLVKMSVDWSKDSIKAN